MKTNIKRATIYFDPELHTVLKMKAAQMEKTVSELVNIAIRQSLAEDWEDLSAFEERKNEPNLDFEDVLNELKKNGKI